jgi:hypothetical protein
MKVSLLITIAIIANAVNCFSQDSTFVLFDKQRIKHQKTGMTILSAWSAANIVGGLVLRNNTQDDTRYFHEMNILWNGVNLFIAGTGYYNSINEVANQDPFHVLAQQLKLEKTLLFNIGIDVAYGASGLYLLEKGKSESTLLKRQRLRGYGRSLIMQGGFLFLFDSVFYAIEANASHNLRESMSLFFISPTGIGFKHTF